MRTKLFLIFFLFFIPFCNAFPCEYTIDQNYCENVEADDTLYSALLYQNVSHPDHEFIKNYNDEIKVTSQPINASTKESTYIKDAWLALLSISPSVYEENILYVPSEITARSAYGYRVIVPQDYGAPHHPENSQGDCKRTYDIDTRKDTLNYFYKGYYKGQGRTSTFAISGDGYLHSSLYITTDIRVKHYEWEQYCCWYKNGECKKYCHNCNYATTTYEKDSLFLNDYKELTHYTKQPQVGISLTNQYFNTLKGNYSTQDASGFTIAIGNSTIQGNNYYYDVVFEDKPFYIAYLRANNKSSLSTQGVTLTNTTFIVPESYQCTSYTYNHFYESSPSCDLTIHQEEIEELTSEESNFSLSLLVKLLLFLLVIYIIYRCLESQYKKFFFSVLLSIITIPIVHAEECGLSNLGSCIPEKLYDFIMLLINAPILPLLAAIKGLLVAEVSIELFHHLWSVIRYILGFFYLFFFIYAGFIFLTSNANPIRRGYAKDMLTNTFLMIILIQGSYYLYGLFLSLASALNNTILDMIDPLFFLITIDNFANIGLEFIFVFTYMLVITFTVIFLGLRYILVSFGVVLLPIGLFLYYIPPLRGYGKYILNLLGLLIFITFFDLLIILACSLLLVSPVFANIKILVMICCFLIVNYTLYLTFKFALQRSTNSSLKDDVNQAVKYIAAVI